MSQSSVNSSLAKALYSFEGQAENHELSFAEGDLLTILDEDTVDGWFFAEKDGIRGLVPASYIMVN